MSDNVEASSTPEPVEEKIPEAKADLGFDLDMGMDIPDIPEVEVDATDVVEDGFEGAVRYAFLGVGHAGSRVCETFHKLGYNRVLAVNTASQDLEDIALPEENKYCICMNKGGAGGKRSLGRELVSAHSEEILERMRKSFGSKFDRIIIISSLGGGTGSGGFEPCVMIANELVESLGIKRPGDSTKVGLISILPSNSERDRMSNAYEAMKAIDSLVEKSVVSPVVIMDNNRITEIYKNVTIGNVMNVVNSSIASTFHLFNQIANTKSQITAFDPQDYMSVLDSGYVTFGAMKIPAQGDPGEQLSEAFRNNLSGNVLTAGLNLSSAKVAACVLIGKPEIVCTIKAADVDNAYEALGRVIAGGVVYRGIYSAPKPLSAYTFIGGLDKPNDRLEEIKKLK